MELPAELQLQIYEFAVIEDDTVNFHCPRRTIRTIPHRKPPPAPGHIGHVACHHPDHLPEKQPTLALTCRYLRETVLPIYYATNRFEMFCGGAYRVSRLDCWMSSVPEAYRPMLRNAFIRVDEPDIEGFGERDWVLVLAEDILRDPGGSLAGVEGDDCCFQILFQ